LAAPNWSAGIEFNHLFLGDENLVFAAPIIAPLQPVQNISQDVDPIDTSPQGTLLRQPAIDTLATFFMEL
jgi:hypothetical protein